MLHDPKDYPEPDEFKPERFIGKDGNLDPNVRDPNTIVFGFGRRCVFILLSRHRAQRHSLMSFHQDLPWSLLQQQYTIHLHSFYFARLQYLTWSGRSRKACPRKT